MSFNQGGFRAKSLHVWVWSNCCFLAFRLWSFNEDSITPAFFLSHAHYIIVTWDEFDFQCNDRDEIITSSSVGQRLFHMNQHLPHCISLGTTLMTNKPWLTFTSPLLQLYPDLVCTCKITAVTHQKQQTTWFILLGKNHMSSNAAVCCFNLKCIDFITLS